ncbi:MAG: ABC transporter substrate-binding protein [Alphaproteobacteria bacterium]|jgi:phospholipid transport system substrate-binding protein|nr:ABC transporter substrate-binding protein [Alphaproteobacteria bacterium]
MFPNRIVLIIFATFLFIFSSKQQYALAANDPGEYVMKMTKSAIDTLTNQSISQEEKENQFGKLFDKNFDVPSISRFVLGKYWKQASTDQKKKFIKTFRNYIVKTYSSRFGEYSGEQLELLNTENESNPKIFLVHTALQRQDAPIIKVDWRIGKKKDRFVILDIIIEGISLAVTQRSEFVSVIDQNEGNIDKLISLLKEKS